MRVVQVTQQNLKIFYMDLTSTLKTEAFNHFDINEKHTRCLKYLRPKKGL